MSSSSSTSSPCAACKFLRRKCQPECVFAPYFPPDQPQKFANVHKVFGASNVTKLLNELHPHQREDAVNSLAYEADMRLRDPVYGCVGVISLLQHQLRQLQIDLSCAKSELSKYQSLSNYGINPFNSGGANSNNNNNNYHHHQFFPSNNISSQYQQQPQQQQQVVDYLRTPTANNNNSNNNNNYDQIIGLHGHHQFQQSLPRGLTGDDRRTTVDP
ncbi:protein ASYMMETRIC LEAVES 2 [Impatiens glandulifera]|uniref:protein ASYMMETRIC LEAVES 2 n=1 Tax=Impatiens glandulifera TaxID=253017 RepID=UPI001FB13A2F|nr:protein ASYMMETRIC LEAVES 2 [Impatiens glandulifera]XP_047331883.1 protein ASYMMETRIC LEAVES 2 [Impatiens glandulifera]XP_047331890.1 protein ASYMMETRIC LEAVES 2 [Impatiens glandulifera]